ncbi:MAG: flagellar hook-basal body complex protein [Desulfobulbaceae bacterium]|nr:flagellar hook-basal body complex protein [Desulfobulbaceae bacterium]
MSISSSLYAGISGLSTMGESMGVLGDNVANVNTVAFKSSRSTFQDILSQSVSTASGGAQVGRGVTLSTISSLFAQGSFESSSSPTDMAIGGQGFFMLRAPDNAAADMYTRAGEFGFDQNGNLINPAGYYTQGWTIDSATGERQGTIGDINIGKNTPPVTTTKVDVIVNLDSRKLNEVNEDRLFNSWNATNLAAANPTDPIDSNKYDYTTAVKIYDAKGASHDLSVYYDRTTVDNQWEFLVTCDPTEDLRVLNTTEQAIYNPDTRYNYLNHKGAGALMYGTIQFDTSGNISQIDGYKVPPDGKVDPSLAENRLYLEAGTSYFQMPANFTGDTRTNDLISINFGSRYESVVTPIHQVLVSDNGARVNGAGGDLSGYITSATKWADVADASGKLLANGDTFTYSGYQNTSVPIGPITYTIDTTKDVQDFLTQIGLDFKCTATIDSQGRLRLSDNTIGDSSMFVTQFSHTTASGADPFGSQVNITTSKKMVVSTGRAVSAAGTTTPITAATLLSSVYAVGNATPLATGDQIDFTYGASSTPYSYTVPNTGATPPPTVQDMLNDIEANMKCSASIDAAGRLVLTDWVADTVATPSTLAATITSYNGGPNIFGAAAAFDAIPADVNTEDGSQQGDVVTTSQAPEALATTQYANSSTTIFQDQDGFASGFLQSVSTDVDGVITGHYSNGQVLKKAQVALASFSNLGGLRKEGGNIFKETTDSGAPVTGTPGTNGLGSIAPNALEQSNVDLGTEFVKLITVQRGFQANSKIITTVDDMLNELINIKR